eukprot:SAG31_NODE_4238_length_3431_cov_6.833733_3_plen_90_part_00
MQLLPLLYVGVPRLSSHWAVREIRLRCSVLMHAGVAAPLQASHGSKSDITTRGRCPYRVRITIWRVKEARGDGHHWRSHRKVAADRISY